MFLHQLYGSNKQSFSQLLHCVRGGPCVVIYWMVKTDSGSILVNALCYKSITLSPLCFRFLSSHCAQKHNLHLNALFCSLSSNKSSKLEAEAWLWTSDCLTWRLFLFSFQICISSSLSLSRGEWFSWSCRSCLNNFSPSAHLSDGRLCWPAVAWIPRLWASAASSHPGLILLRSREELQCS